MPEIPDEDLQFVLKALLAVYQPVLEEELRPAKAPDLTKEAESRPSSCKDEPVSPFMTLLLTALPAGRIKFDWTALGNVAEVR